MQNSPKTTTMPHNKDPKIPLLTVIKNGAILKNIFVVNHSAIPSRPAPLDQTLLVGRHPDCTIALTHPSISRFHLQIHTLPSAQKLAVTDLSSVHGTFVSGVRIEAGTRVELKEGDTLQLGGSSRIYRLQWVPLSQAYDFETPFVSDLDDKIAEYKDDENAIAMHQKKENISKQVQVDTPTAECNENELAEANISVSIEEKDIRSVDSASDDMATLYINENSGVYTNNVIPSAPPVPEAVTDIFHEEGRLRNSSCEDAETKLVSSAVDGFILGSKNQQFDEGAQHLQPHCDVETLSDAEYHSFEAVSSPVCEEGERKFGDDWCGSSHTKSMNLSSGVDVVISENGSHLFMQNKESLRAHEDMGMESLHCTNFINFSSPVVAVSSGSHQSVGYKQSLRKHSFTEALFDVEGSPNVNLTNVLKLDSDRSAEVAESHAEMEPSNERESLSKLKATQNVTQSYNRPLGEIIDSNNKLHDEGTQTAGNLFDRQLTDEGKNTKEKAEERKSDLVMKFSSVLADEVFTSAEKAGVTDMHDTWSIDSIHCNYGVARPASLEADSARSSISVGEALVKTQDGQFINENKTPQSHYSGGLAERQALHSPPLKSQKKKTPRSHYSSGLTERQALKGPSVSSQKNSSLSSTRLRSVKPPGVLPIKKEKSQGSSSLGGTAAKNQMELKENTKIKRKLKNSSSGSNWEEEEALTPGKENRDPQYSCSSGPTQRLGIESPPIWSRRGKPAGILRVKTENDQEKSLQTDTDAKVEVKLQKIVEDKTIIKEFSSDIDGYEVEIFTPDKENLTPGTLMFGSRKKMGNFGNTEKSLNAASNLHFDTNGEKGQMFTPNKENLTPTALMSRSIKKKGELRNVEDSKPLKATTSELIVGLDLYPLRDLFASPNKGKQTLEKVLEEQESAKTNTNNKFAIENENFVMDRKAERVPFQSLPANSSSFIPSASTQSCTSVGLSQGILKKNDPVEMCKLTRWIMFVDTASLVDKESMKALQLLQGIKGTRLFIPRIVIRELERLRQREILFGRTSEASQVLQWIEDSVNTTNWWIQVQSSVDEARLIASTPPASPQSMMCQEISPPGSLPSAGYNFNEMMSPTPEDHVLDCVLHYRKMNNDAQTILISNDVNVKIKAMAEGLLCETAIEFRESLVNPFSGRFLWTDSCPRGLTWNCLDDVVLKQKYYPSPKTKLLKREAKGLKLILLHNARYGRT